MCEQSELSYKLEISTFMSGDYKNKAATRLKHKLLSFQESSLLHISRTCICGNVCLLLQIRSDIRITRYQRLTGKGV